MTVPVVASIALAAGLAAAPLQAQHVHRCAGSWIAPSEIADFLVSTRGFANRAVQIGILDIGSDTACCAVFAVVVLPHPEGGDACFLLSHSPASGFDGIDLQGAPSSYDPVLGLLVELPVARSGADGDGPLRVPLRINQATGEVTIETDATGPGQ